MKDQTTVSTPSATFKNGQTSRFLILALVLAGLLLFLFVRQRGAAERRDLVFNHVTVIDATGRPAQPDMTVVIRGGRILALGQTGTVEVAPEANKIDATGKYLIPGLWDMHVHASNKEAMEVFFPLYIANGITGVRDMGNTPGEFALLKKWREEIENGRRIGPHIVTPGMILDGPKPELPIGVPLTSAAQARETVDSLQQQGASFIKVYVMLPRETYFAIADEAKKKGIPFAGHVPVSMSALEVSNAGQRSIEHVNGIPLACSSDEAKLREGQVKFAERSNVSIAEVRAYRRAERDEVFDTYSESKAAALFAAFKKNNTWQVPTLVVHRAVASLSDPAFRNDLRLKYIPKSIQREWREKNSKLPTPKEIEDEQRYFQSDLQIVGAMHRAGVPILAGTDSPIAYIFPGFSLHDELTLLVRAGFTPMEALQAATVYPAKYLGKLDTMGTIEKGKMADLALLDSNPLDDIRNTQRVVAVVLGQRFFSESDIASLLASAASRVSKR